ncbi:MAG: hypothetical protein Q9170_007640 [Blastenia crenularia]
MDTLPAITLATKGHQVPRWYTYKQLWLLGENHFCNVDTTTMGLTKEDLLAHSRYIRDTLVPRLARDEAVLSGKHTFDLTHLRAALDELHNSPMTVEILRFSRIEKALQRIVEAKGGNWPPDIVFKAKSLIAKWEGSLGPLQRVRSPLWGTGGRLEELTRSEEGINRNDWGRHISGTPSWIVEQNCDLGRAHTDGHSGFKIGDWWLNSAAACRDGIIDNTNDQITADDDGAYAIVMTQHAETHNSKDESCSYTSHASERGVFKLMSTINGEHRNPIRVLRSWRLQSALAPVAGIRYDGLYRVTGYGVKLRWDSETREDNWRYTFHLKREPGQETMEKALTFPNPDQLDDWEDYKAGLTYGSEDDMFEETYEDVLGLDQRHSIGPEAADRLGSVDSGYFSPHPATLKDEVSSP